MKHCFVLQMKKLLHIKGYFTVKCSVVAEVAFKFKSYYRCIFFYQGLFHRHQWFTRQQGKGGDHLYSSLSVPPAHKRSDIYKRSHSCMQDDYHVFLFASIVITRLLINKTYYLWELLFDWLVKMMKYWFLFAGWLNSRFCFSSLILEIGRLELTLTITQLLPTSTNQE